MDKKLLEKTVHEDGILRILKSGNPGGLYFIFGDENFLKLHYANLIAQQTVGDSFTDFNFHRLDGSLVSIEAIRDAAESLPMFSERTCVLIHDLPINSMKKNDLENLKQILENVPETCSFILLMDTVYKKTGKNDKEKTGDNNIEGKDDNESESDEPEPSANTVEKKVDAWDEILTIALQRGLAIQLNKRNTTQLIPSIIKKAADKGCNLDYETAGYLIECVGNDIANLHNEIEKICRYAKGKQITVKDINAISAKTVEARTFDMVDCLIEKKNDEAYSILQTLFSQKVEPLVIMGTLIFPFADMYRLKTAIAAGKKADDLANDLNCGNRLFRLRTLSTYVKKKSFSQLSRCLDYLDEADIMLKTGSTDKRLIIEQTMTKIGNELNG